MRLVHPLETRAIASTKIKNDKIDSTILAHLLRTSSALILCSREAPITGLLEELGPLFRMFLTSPGLGLIALGNSFMQYQGCSQE